EVLELPLAADQVVEAVGLPTPARPRQQPVQADGRVALPRLALVSHPVAVRERYQQVDVVRHDDEVGHQVPVAVKVQQAIGDDLRTVRPPEDTGPVAPVEGLLPPGRYEFAEFVPEVGREPPQPPLPVLGVGVDAVTTEPRIPLRHPAGQYTRGDRIPCAPRDEAKGAGLGPVGEPAFDDPNLGGRIEDADPGCVVRVHRISTAYRPLAQPRTELLSEL